MITLSRQFAAPAAAATGHDAPATTIAPPPLTGAYELYCPGSPVGDIALNDVMTTATLSPASENLDDTFNVTGYQTAVNLPNDLASAAAALSPTLTGTAVGQVDVTGATPATLSTGTESFSLTIPSPVPAAGVTLTVPTQPATLGPFTAISAQIVVQEDSATGLTLIVSGSPLALTCTSYPNDSVTPSGITTSAPTSPPIAPVIAESGATTVTTLPPPTTTGPVTSTTTAPVTSTTTAPPGGTAPYELYCPGTPVGNIVLNDVVTTGTLSPADPSPGQTFSLTGFQSVLNLPSAIVSAAAALGNSAIIGSAILNVDATGATPATLSAGSLDINAPIPSPVPAAGLTVELPSSPGTVGPFTASGGAITLAVDSSISLTIVVSGSNLDLTCTPYPNDSTPTGITSSTPSGPPASPVIATTGSGPPPTTTTVGPTTTTVGPTTTTVGPTTTAAPTTIGTTTTTGGTTTTAPANTLVPSTGSAPLAAGSSVTISGSGFQPGETVDFSIFSVQVDLGTAQADANGNVTKTVAIPTSFTGTHTISATGTTSGHVDSVTVVVSSSSPSTTSGPTSTAARPAPTTAATQPVPAVSSRQLAFTGTGSTLRWMAFAGALLVGLAGAVLLGMAFRRASVLLAAPGASLPIARRDRVAGFGTRRVGDARRVSSWLLGRQR